MAFIESLDALLRERGTPAREHVHQAGHSVALSYLYFPSVAWEADVPPPRLRGGRGRGRPRKREKGFVPWWLRNPIAWQTAINPFVTPSAPVEALFRRVEAPVPPGLSLSEVLTNAWAHYAIPLPPRDEYDIDVFFEDDELEHDAHVRAATVVAFAGAEAEKLFHGTASRKALSDDRARLKSWAAAARAEKSRMLRRGRTRAADFVRVREQDILRCAAALSTMDAPVEWCGPSLSTAVDVPPLPDTPAIVSGRLREWIAKRRGKGAWNLSGMYQRLSRSGVQISRPTWYRLARGEASVEVVEARRILSVLGASADEIAAVVTPD